MLICFLNFFSSDLEVKRPQPLYPNVAKQLFTVNFGTTVGQFWYNSWRCRSSKKHPFGNKESDTMMALSSYTTNFELSLHQKHRQELLEKRALDERWIQANCRSTLCKSRNQGGQV